MFNSFDLSIHDSHSLGWEIGAIYKERAYANRPEMYDRILGYHDGYVVVLRMCGDEVRLVQHLTPLSYSRSKVKVIEASALFALAEELDSPADAGFNGQYDTP